MDEDLERTIAAVQPHVQEMRRRLMYVFLFFFIATGAVFYYSQDILTWLRADLGVTLHALTAPEVFYTQLTLAAIIGFVATLPVTLYHTLKFLRPGLRPDEYRILRNYLPLFVVLFAFGAVFAYEVIVKMSLQFFQNVTSAASVDAVWGLKNTITFALKLSAASGVLFQLPLISLILAKAGMLTAHQMKQYRAYVIVAVLLIAAVATPPDILTQIMVTAPVLLLYQFSILLVSRMERRT